MRVEIARILRESSNAILKITTRERTSSIALNQEKLKSVDKIKGFSDADKQKVREIFSKNLEEGKGMRGSARDLKEAFANVDSKRAESIARTGHTEINNIAQNQIYKEKGFQSFTVDIADDGNRQEDECDDEYTNTVFHIDDVEKLPPLHPKCMCMAIYHEETAEEYAALHGLEVYGGDEETPEPESSGYVSTDIPELQDLQETIDYINQLSNNELSSILENSISSVLGTSSVDEALVSDVVGSMDSFLNDPVSLIEREPLKANILLELLKRLKILV